MLWSRGADSGDNAISVTYIHIKTGVAPHVLRLCGKALTFLPAAWCAENCPWGRRLGPAWVGFGLGPSFPDLGFSHLGNGMIPLLLALVTPQGESERIDKKVPFQ